MKFSSKSRKFSFFADATQRRFQSHAALFLLGQKLPLMEELILAAQRTHLGFRSASGLLYGGGDTIANEEILFLSIADIPHIKAADFFGIATGNKMADAPIVEEFPLPLEYRVVEDKMEIYGHHVIEEIVGVLADESVLDEKGKVDSKKLNTSAFDPFQNGYYAIGEKAGQARHTDVPLMGK